MKFFYPLLLPAAARLCGAASTLLRGGTIVAFDEDSNSLQVIREGSLLIKDDTISGIFESGQEPGSDDGDDEREVIDVTGKIITPGFVDTHRHGWQTSLKTLVANSPLWDYLQRFSEFAAAGLLTADDVYISQLAGLYESLNTGVTTIVDHAHHTWSNETGEAGLAASIESGARVFWAYTFHNVTNYTTTEQYAHFRAVADKASFAGTRTSLGIGCDYFGGLTPNKYEIQKVVDLALYVHFISYCYFWFGVMAVFGRRQFLTLWEIASTTCLLSQRMISRDLLEVRDIPGLPLSQCTSQLLGFVASHFVRVY
jgi:cytosine/adenosine deaminase-related metal-dependent hydrolase